MKTTDELLRKQGLTFQIVNDTETMEKIYALRFEVFCEEMGVCSLEEFPNGKEWDKYDERSVHVTIMRQEEIIAYARLILPPGPFPIEEYDKLVGVNKRASVEISKALVIKEWRQTNMIWILFNNIYDFCQKNGTEYILIFTHSVLFGGFQKRDILFYQVGKPALFHGYKSYPLVIKINHDITPNFY